MPKRTLTIDTVLGGVSPLEFFGRKGDFQPSLGLDPEMPKDDSSIIPSGVLRPTSMAKFSGTEITGVPLWIISNPKDTNAYAYANDGKVHVVASDLTMGTALNSGTAMTAAAGNGAGYYDNYIYFAKQADVARYGPLNGSPSLVQNYWTSTLSKTALANTTYPSIKGVAMPNHVMHRHTDDKIYFADVVDNKGVLHFIKTTKTTVEGDTDDSSAYNALDFDAGYYPTAIETYGTDLAVALIEGVNTTVKQKTASLSFWDASNTSFSKIIQVEFPDPLITALKNVNGVLFVFSGSANGGCRISYFAGGYSYVELAYLPDTVPPFHGAVDHLLNRIVWGGSCTIPSSAACVYSYRARQASIPMGVHNILKSSSANTTNQFVTAVKYFDQTSPALMQPIIGWTDGAGKGLDKRSTTYGTSIFRSEVFRIGQKFDVVSVRIPLTVAIAANMTITPKLYFDDGSATKTLTVINSTNFSDSRKTIVQRLSGASGWNSFYLELTWSGTALCPVSLPIMIDIETKDE